MNRSSRENMIRAAAFLGLFAVVCTAVVVMTFENTHEKIKQSEKQFILKKLHTLIKPQEHDNDLFADTIKINDTQFLHSTDMTTVYRARYQGQPIAVLFTTNAPDGYSGTIKILVGIYHNGTLAGIRIISHKETPGLGDAIDEKKSPWVYSFNQKSLANTPQKNWQVKKDGGQFDQFTGATITPRAIINAVHNALRYFNANKNLLFSIEKSNGKSIGHN